MGRRSDGGLMAAVIDGEDVRRVVELFRLNPLAGVDWPHPSSSTKARKHSVDVLTQCFRTGKLRAAAVGDGAKFTAPLTH